MNKRKSTLLKLGLFISFSTVAIHIINRMISASAVLKNLLNTKNGSYYKWRFGNVFYTKQGSGSPILLIHDLSPSSSAAEWESVVDELSQNHTVYVIDLLGCGRSDKPPITYTNFLYVQLLTDFANNVIGQKPDVVASGLSGSFIVMACAHGEAAFGKIMLINPADMSILNQIPSKTTKIAKYLLELPLLGTFVYNIITAKSNIELLFTEKYLYNPFSLSQSVIDTYYESAHLNDGKYLLSSIIGKYIYFNISHGLKSISNKVLVITGEHCQGGNEAIAQYSSLNKTLAHEIIPKTKFLPQQEDPAQLISLANIFFE